MFDSSRDAVICFLFRLLRYRLCEIFAGATLRSKISRAARHFINYRYIVWRYHLKPEQAIAVVERFVYFAAITSRA